MKKLLFVLTLAVAVSSSSFAVGGKKAAKKTCTKTEMGCCKKGEKVSACCANSSSQKLAKR